jgi:Mrp family chromosome partitioning ATPase
MGEHSLDVIIFDSHHPRLKIIPSGDSPPNPGELLADNKLTSLIDNLSQRYEVVVIDSAPLMVADIFQYAEQVDGFIYVIRQAMTERPALEKALEELKRQRLKHVGIIYNDIQPNRFGADYGYGYGYGYEYSYTPKGGKISKKESWIERLILKVESLK